MKSFLNSSLLTSIFTGQHTSEKQSGKGKNIVFKTLIVLTLCCNLFYVSVQGFFHIGIKIFGLQSMIARMGVSESFFFFSGLVYCCLVLPYGHRLQSEIRQLCKCCPQPKGRDVRRALKSFKIFSPFVKIIEAGGNFFGNMEIGYALIYCLGLVEIARVSFSKQG